VDKRIRGETKPTPTNTQCTMGDVWTRNNFSLYVPMIDAHAINLGHKWQLTYAQIEIF
jgi:hypothetical protein